MIRRHQNERQRLERLVNENTGLATSALALYLRRRPLEQLRPLGIERDDLHSVALLGLHQAAMTWQPGRGAFSTHAYRVILSALRDMVSAARALRRGGGLAPLSLDDPVADSATLGDLVLVDTARGPEQIVTSAAGFDEMIGPLPPRLREAARCVWGEQLDRKEAAQRLGVTLGTLNTMCSDAVQRLRAASGVAHPLPCS